jgi:hypothetical protein
MGLQRELPPADIVPGPPFIAYGVIDPDGFKPERLVQPDARRVRQRDAGIGVI